ncbi:MAG: toll/interleukin-1 receptor domain-containing protein [Acidaminococcales bacterium]|jgi:hypothetical protein|nr:toll/interleukin-1 receptor domain-containing protein [Acidaminococcales bacterium]
MIFLSRNSKDKPVVEQLAIKLRDVFGHGKVFYDAWSIQPGDGIIDKINQGLSDCRFFFPFCKQNTEQYGKIGMAECHYESDERTMQVYSCKNGRSVNTPNPTTNIIFGFVH